MNYVFFGTPEFATIVLEKLIAAGFVPAAVVCNPDRLFGRKHIITPPPTKLLAQKFNIPAMQPEVLSISNFQSPIPNPDFFVIAAFAKIISKEILDIPRLGSIGVHPSLLPKYRGATPIQNAILNGEKETGVTLYLMDEKMDHGPILKNEKLEIRNKDTYETLLKKLAELAGDLLIETIPKFLAGEITPQEQAHEQATYTKKFTTEDGFVDPKELEEAEHGNAEKAEGLDRKIRALNPEPGTWTMRDEKRVKLLEAELKNDALKLTKIQFEGRKPVLL